MVLAHPHLSLDKIQTYQTLLTINYQHKKKKKSTLPEIELHISALHAEEKKT